MKVRTVIKDLEVIHKRGDLPSPNYLKMSKFNRLTNKKSDP
ncbi:hypothetical protein A33Q_0357 [Indibacter alkaliphilus LW1]|uniref:Uncharacterized protein n=1 Tax=Indibacter alkaliphilus (strain CCUG 57479 / KCTC 22604 / LW1) TaxID=1189612 RepID=S2E512_INDAL|nr:hypothetical protein A33Q_0357 [Indibacter alkaliphilus LW1]